MAYKVIIKKGKNTLVSDHRLKKNAIDYRDLIIRGRKKGKIASDTSIRIIKVKKLTR